jgi:mannitol/fructose-specific phosphotransferase system IIA component (Ntr-type)
MDGMLSKLFSTPAMELALKAGDRESVFRDLIALVPGLDDGARAGLLLSLLGRERLGSTGLGRGVALPHTRYAVPGVNRPQIIFARHNHGIAYGALDGAPVKLFFLLVSPDVSQHLQILARLTRVLRDPHVLAELLVAATPQEILGAIQEAERRVQVGNEVAASSV